MTVFSFEEKQVESCTERTPLVFRKRTRQKDDGLESEKQAGTHAFFTAASCPSLSRLKGGLGGNEPSEAVAESRHRPTRTIGALEAVDAALQHVWKH